MKQFSKTVKLLLGLSILCSLPVAQAANLEACNREYQEYVDGTVRCRFYSEVKYFGNFMNDTDYVEAGKQPTQDACARICSETRALDKTISDEIDSVISIRASEGKSDLTKAEILELKRQGYEKHQK